MGFATPTSRNKFRLRVAPFDLIWAIASPVIAVALRDASLLYVSNPSDLTSPVFVFLAVASVTAILAIFAFRLSQGMGHLFSVHDLIAITAAVAASVAATSVVLFTFTRLEGVPRSIPTIYAMLFGGGLVMARALHRAFGGERPRLDAPNAPDLLRNVIVVGADRFSVNIVKLMASQLPRTARVVAMLDERTKFTGRAVAGVRVAGSPDDLGVILDEYRVHGVEIDQVLISNPQSLSEEAQASITALCKDREIECENAADVFNLKPKAKAVSPVRAAGPEEELGPYFEFKRLMDFVGSIFLLVLLTPIIALVCVLVLVDVGSPVLFWQERLGRNGRRFLLYKFRTYRAPFDWRGEPVPEEERLSRVGRLVRATRLDEIPQLMNIIVGDMSLIGPRPLLPHDQPNDPSVRLLVPPGITGWAQVNGGNLVTPEEKDALDAWYIRNASLWVDIQIVILTFMVAARGERLNRTAVAEALAKEVPK